MRHDAPILVMRRAPMIGRPESRPRVTVAAQEYRLADAIAWVASEREMAARNAFMRQGSQFWIEARGASARRSS